MAYADPVAANEVAEVYPKVAAIIADSLGRDVEDLAPDKALIGDLGAESIDFLDIVYRLERAFHVKIPRGQIEAQARGGLSEAEFESQGVLTAAGVARLREFLSEVPASRFRDRMKLVDLPSLFTVETFCKIVARARRR